MLIPIQGWCERCWSNERAYSYMSPSAEFFGVHNSIVCIVITQ